MNFKKIIGLLVVSVSFLTAAGLASAHVVVKPASVGVAAFQTFTMGVPVEKDITTTGLRLVIPDGLKYVSPNVKPGWSVSVKKEGEGEDAHVTEISWTGGSIPSGQRDDFVFSAQAPAKEGELHWKAYQTYADGSIVTWDQEPKDERDDDSAGGPYSVTKVVNDLNATAVTTPTTTGKSERDDLSKTLSVAAILIAGGALWMQIRKK